MQMLVDAPLKDFIYVAEALTIGNLHLLIR
jgi:hypothetical protein